MGAHLSFWRPFSGTMDSKKVGWNRTIKRWSTFCTGAPSPYSTTVINWPNKECPLCYLKRHKPGHRRTIKDIVLNLLPLEMDFSRAKLPFWLSGLWNTEIILLVICQKLSDCKKSASSLIMLTLVLGQLYHSCKPKQKLRKQIFWCRIRNEVTNWQLNMKIEWGSWSEIIRKSLPGVQS